MPEVEIMVRFLERQYREKTDDPVAEFTASCEAPERFGAFYFHGLKPSSGGYWKCRYRPRRRTAEPHPPEHWLAGIHLGDVLPK